MDWDDGRGSALAGSLSRTLSLTIPADFASMNARKEGGRSELHAAACDGVADDRADKSTLRA
jgi:hypothetical protein